MDALEKESKLPLKGWENEVARAKEFGLEAAKSIVDRKISTFSRGELPHFAGINTFMKAPYLENVNEVANYLREQAEALVAKHPTFFLEVRGKGMMLGFVCKVTNLDMWNKLRDAGLLTVPADDNVIRFLPPLIIERAHVDEALGIVDEVASAWEQEDAGA